MPRYSLFLLCLFSNCWDLVLLDTALLSCRRRLHTVDVPPQRSRMTFGQSGLTPHKVILLPNWARAFDLPGIEDIPSMPCRNLPLHSAQASQRNRSNVR